MSMKLMPALRRCGRACARRQRSGVAASMQASAHTGHSDHSFAAGEPGDAKQPFRVVEILMTDGPGTMAYTPDRIEVKKGEQIKFVLKNVGQVDHEFLINSFKNNAKHKLEMEKDPEMAHDEPNGARLKPNSSKEILWRFTQGRHVRVRLPASWPLRDGNEGCRGRQVTALAERLVGQGGTATWPLRRLVPLVAGLEDLPDPSCSMMGQCGRWSPSQASARWRRVLIICRSSVARTLEFVDVGQRDGLDVGAAALLVAPELEQFADALEGKAEIARAANEEQTVNVGIAIVPVSAVRAARLRDQADGFVVADHFGGDAGSLGGLSDVHGYVSWAVRR